MCMCVNYVEREEGGMCVVGAVTELLCMQITCGPHDNRTGYKGCRIVYLSYAQCCSG